MWSWLIMISDEHIHEAEQILIDGNQFDRDERVPFIKNLSSCDLLAVPGSGKTTALLAKLYCLAKHLPFKDRSGILILSHTNTAVNEIEHHLKPYCPKLFEYPNFVGTIQSFVNKFLANPACGIKYDSSIQINDNDMYEREAIKFYHSLEWKPTEPKGLKNKLFGRLNARQNDLTYEQKCNNIMKFLKDFELDLLNRKILYNNRSLYTHNGTSQLYYLELENWKHSLYEQGILNYKDSFYFAEWYINSYSNIKQILQSRFKFVFIDEMQDLEKFQIDIIDKLFFNENSSTVIQRIGDVNQAIYNSGTSVKVKADWIPRNQMYLNDSNRLTSDIANIVNSFTLDQQINESGEPRFETNGLRTLDQAIKPHLIMFDNQSKNRLRGKFKELIENHSLQETDEGKKYGFHILGWSATWGESQNDGRLRLENIFPEYNKNFKANKNTFDSLSEYLQNFDKSSKSLVVSKNIILKVLIHVLKLEKKTYTIIVREREVKRYFSVSEMIRFIKSNDNRYKSFKKFMYQWSMDLSTKMDYQAVYSNIKQFIFGEFKEWFNLTISSETSTFIGELSVPTASVPEFQSEPENSDLFGIKIGTVHSAKGQTHCATMYVETSYHSYETQKTKIIDALKKINHGFNLANNTNVRGKEALKMMYVGFSRPTHLLCFACLKENISGQEANFSSAGWELIDLTS